MATQNQTQQLLNLAAKIVTTNQVLLAAINGGNVASAFNVGVGNNSLTSIQGLVDAYNKITAVTPYTDALFAARTNPNLQFLTAYNLGVLVQVLQVFLQVYQDQTNYVANAGRNESIMQLCQS